MERYCCSRCKAIKYKAYFAYCDKSPSKRQSYCKECQRAYYREYIVPALRGRGFNRVLPSWLRKVVMPPVSIPGKVIVLQTYRDGQHLRRRAVVGA